MRVGGSKASSNAESPLTSSCVLRSRVSASVTKAAMILLISFSLSWLLSFALSILVYNLDRLYVFTVSLADGTARHDPGQSFVSA